MINAVFIISASGGCIFYHEFKKLGGGLDQDLVSGFLVALQNFAKETFGVEQDPQKLDLAGDLRLVYSLNRETQLLGACVADAIDHPKLVQRLIDKILTKFVTLFKGKLETAYEVGQFTDFVDFVERTITRRISKRGPLSCFLGILITAGIIPLILIPMLILLIRINPNFVEQQLLMTTFLFVVGGLPQVLAGFIAGNKKLAVIASVILSLAIIPVVILGFVLNIFITGVGWEGTLLYLVFMPLIFPENIALAYFGGYRREVRRLNPLKK